MPMLRDSPPLHSSVRRFVLALTIGVAPLAFAGPFPMPDGVAVSGRPGQERCIYFRDPDGHRLQLMVRL